MIWNKTECELVVADLTEMLIKRAKEEGGFTQDELGAFMLGVASLHGEIKRKLADYE